MHTIHLLKAACLCAVLPLAIPTATVQAVQVPQEVNYQATVTNEAGDLVGTPAPVERDIVFRIYDQAVGGTLIWAERQTVTIFQGNFNTLLGTGIANGTEVRPDIASVFNGEARFIEITLESAGTDPLQTFLPRQRFVSTPYAFRAAEAEVARTLATDGVGLNLDGPLTVSSLSIDGNINNTTSFPVRVSDSQGLAVNTDLSVGNDLTVDGDLAVAGNLDIQGAINNSTAGQGVVISDPQGLQVQGSGAFITGELTVGTSKNGLKISSSTRPFAGSTVNRVILFGEKAGALGTVRDNGNNVFERVALSWDNAGNVASTQSISAGGEMYAQGDITANGRINFGNSAQVGAYIERGGPDEAGYIAIGSEGSLFAGTNRRFFYDGDSNLDFDSDRRWKDGIVDAPSVLDGIRQLKIRNFHFKNDPGKKTQFGVIAQEVEPLFPFLVSDAPETSPQGDHYKTVAYTDFGLIATSGVKELAAVVDTANERIDRLKSELSTARDENAALQRQLSLLLERVARLEARR